MKIIVLMSTYNGEKYINQQLDSVLEQDVTGQGQLQILVRDDGSTDATRQILDRYQAEGKLQWYGGENLGPEKSFWHLMGSAPQGDFYAFCDQDDYWFKDKLSRAVALLEKEEKDKPLLYCGTFTATDRDLHPIHIRPSALNKYTDYAHSLIYSTAPGCTFVFNHCARLAAMAYDMQKNPVMIHDWLLHRIVTINGGKMLYDAQSHIYYRQHGNNTIGAQDGGVKGLAARIRRFLTGSSRRVRSDCAKALLEIYGETVTPQVRSALDLVANYTVSPKKRRALLRDKRFQTGTANDLFFRCLVMLRAL